MVVYNSFIPNKPQIKGLSRALSSKEQKGKDNRSSYQRGRNKNKKERKKKNQIQNLEVLEISNFNKVTELERGGKKKNMLLFPTRRVLGSRENCICIQKLQHFSRSAADQKLFSSSFFLFFQLSFCEIFDGELNCPVIKKL